MPGMIPFQPTNVLQGAEGATHVLNEAKEKSFHPNEFKPNFNRTFFVDCVTAAADVSHIFALHKNNLKSILCFTRNSSCKREREREGEKG